MAVFLATLSSCDTERDSGAQQATSQLQVLQTSGEEPGALFTRVRSGAARPDGYLVVIDQRPSRVLLFDPDASAIPLGQEGMGPAEYQRAQSVGFLGDSVWVSDPRMMKVIFFDLQGEHLGDGRVVARPPEPNAGGTLHVCPLADGGWLAQTWPEGISFILAGQAGPKSYYHLVDGVTTPVFSLHLQKSDYLEVDLGNEAWHVGPHPIQSETLFLPDQEGQSYFVVDRPPASSSETAQYRVHRLGLLGDTTWTAALDYDPRPVSDTWKDQWFDLMVKGARDGFGPTGQRLRALYQEQVTFPEFFPPVSEAMAGPAGALWLRETHLFDEENRWLVVSPAGEPQGHVTFPSGFRLLAPGEGIAYGVVKDRLDVETVVKVVAEVEKGSGN